MESIPALHSVTAKRDVQVWWKSGLRHQSRAERSPKSKKKTLPLVSAGSSTIAVSIDGKKIANIDHLLKRGKTQKAASELTLLSDRKSRSRSSPPGRREGSPREGMLRFGRGLGATEG